MKGSSCRHFYLFSGHWQTRFDDLAALVQKNKEQGFELWDPADKTRKLHLLIAIGLPLTDTFCLVKKVWKTDENVFFGFFQTDLNHYHVHRIGNIAPETENASKDKSMSINRIA